MLLIVCSSTRKVFGVREVIYIPLEYTGAKVTLERLVNRLRRSGLQQLAVDPLYQGQPGDGDSLHVKWAPQHLPTTTPDATSVLSSSPTSSGHSTPTTTGASISPLANTLAEKLSFWKRQRGVGGNEASLVASKASGRHETIGEMLHDIDNGDTASIAPIQAVEDIVTAAAPEPQSTEARYLALEVKVLKETVRQFTKGGMYFSYSFGTAKKIVAI
jgi:phosphatidylinositol 4-phosphatase